MEHYFERTSLTWSANSVRLIETASPFAKNHFFYLQEAGYFETRFPYFTERQNLSSYLLVYTISGTGRLIYENQEYTLKKGSVFLIDCMNYHYYETSKEDPWKLLWIHFNGVTAPAYFDELIKNGFAVISPTDTFLFESSLRRILSLHQQKDIHRELITSHLIIALLTELIILNTPKDYFSHFTPDYVNEIKIRLNQEYASHITLDQLAKEFNRNKFHLAKEFKKHTGTTINEYLIDRRISHSKELLKYSSLTVSAISIACGIQNVGHFINLFKEREGTTPLAFRKEWRV